MRLGRRTFHLLAIFIGSAVITVAAMKLSHRFVLRGLAAEVASEDAARAQQAIGELKRMGVAGAPTLVAIACSGRGESSEAAQHSVGQLLDVWERDQKLHANDRKYAERLAVLATSLQSAAANELPADAAVWARRTIVELLRRAEQIPIGQRAALVRTCEQVLNRTQGAQSVASPVASDGPNVVTSNPAAPAPQAQPVESPIFENSEPQSTSPPDEVARTTGIVNSTPIATMKARPNPLRAPPPHDVRWEPKWNAPAVSQQAAAPMPQPEVTPVPTANESPSDRDLLRLWLLHTALSPVIGDLECATIRAAFEHSLASRGFSSLRFEWIVASLSQRSVDRMRLIDELLVSFRSDAPAWLLFLARDESPQVRRAAIVALITSRDRRILALTHDLALRDLDPQVAALAPQIGKLLR